MFNPIKRVDKPKIDSSEGLRPWTPLGGLQRPPNPQLTGGRGLRPRTPLLACASCNFTCSDTSFIKKANICQYVHHYTFTSNVKRKVKRPVSGAQQEALQTVKNRPPIKKNVTTALI